MKNSHRKCFEWCLARTTSDVKAYCRVPTTEKQTVAPDMARRRPNAELRSREHLTADEVERLIAAAKDGATVTATPRCCWSRTATVCASRK
jgi:hypothetical protein